MDHGMERLLIFIFLFFSALASATTFGPIDVSDQIRNSQYFVHGKITQGPWSEMERELGRPYTHWRLEIMEQFSGSSLGNEVIIRQPGGEVGEMGYRVAGSANFSIGEEVYVNLRETSEAGIKEVVGLSSGKYKVDRAGGKEKIQNAIGFSVKVSGKELNAKEFSALAERLVKNQEAEEEKQIFLNQNLTHDHDPVLEQKTKDAVAEMARINPPSSTSKTVQSINNTKEIQDAPSNSEESNDSGIWKIPVLLALLSFIVGAIFIYKNK